MKSTLSKQGRDAFLDFFQKARNKSFALLTTERVSRIVLGTFVGIYVARYLGPERFGELSVAISIVSLFAFLPRLGLQNIIVRHLVSRKDNAAETLGTSLLLQISGGLAGFIAVWVVATSKILDSSGSGGLTIVVVGLSLLVRFADTFSWWYESEVRPHVVVFAKLVSLVSFALLKISLIYQGAGLVWFAACLAGEEFLASAIIILWTYRSTEEFPKTLRFNAGLAREFLKQSYPLLLSAVTISMYMNTDRIMIDLVKGGQETGLYSAATRISEAFYFIPEVVMASIFPSLVRYKESDESRYYMELQRLLNALARIALSLAFVFSIFSKEIILGIYGQEFRGSWLVLCITMWTLVFVCMGSVAGRVYILEGKTSLVLWRSVCAASMNIVLNVIMIPRLGGAGAAIATLIAQVSAGILFDATQGKTRYLFRMKVNSLKAVWWYGGLNQVR